MVPITVNEYRFFRRPAPAPPPSHTVPTTPRPQFPPRPAYRNSVKAASKKPVRSTPLVTLTLLLTTPAVLAAALLRPRSLARRGR
ncbi:hypothetical protein AB0K89_14620 [Streptomyces cinnamoneus]|uniref:hypothetical protein n=1 Tax=Streptomyces cinnamoneus TaxID=53446 RepID=UPI00342F6DE7